MDSKNTIQTTIFSPTDDLSKIMKQSFEFWHKNYSNSLINYPLVWKKALESDPKIIKKIETWNKNSNQNSLLIVEQFFDMWSYVIRKSNYDIALKSIIEWKEFWNSTNYEQFRFCSEILQMIQVYWRDIQSKNIE